MVTVAGTDLKQTLVSTFHQENRALRKVKRWLASASTSSLAFLAICVAILGLVTNTGEPRLSTILLYLLIFVGIMAWLLQTQFEYQRRTYDSTLAFKYSSEWIANKSDRAAAAKLLLEHKAALKSVKDNRALLDPIDDVLDIFEDLGFYMQGDQVTPEVAHHFFYHWIRGYWSAALPYIESRQREELGLWNHLRQLYDETTAIESVIENLPPEKLRLSDTELDDFLNEEIRFGLKGPEKHAD